MFVYQNKAGHICVTFADNKPVKTPEYVIAVDKAAKKLYMVSGTIEGIPEQDGKVVKNVEAESVEEKTEGSTEDETV